MLKPPTIHVWSSVCDLCFSNVSLMNVSALAFGAEIFRTETSSWWNFSFEEYEVSFPMSFE